MTDETERIEPVWESVITDETEKVELDKPKVIEKLIFAGEAVLVISIVTAVVLGAFAWGCLADSQCGDHYGWGWFALAFAVLVGGWFQKQFIHGFSAGLDQLFEIRKNTSN